MKNFSLDKRESLAVLEQQRSHLGHDEGEGIYESKLENDLNCFEEGEFCFSEKEFSRTGGAKVRHSEISRNSLGKTLTLKEKGIEELLRLF